MNKDRARALMGWVAAPIAGAALLYVLRLGVLAICFYAFFFLLVAARLMARFWLRPLAVEREVSDEAIERGSTIKVFIKVTNRAWYPILWNYVEETLPERVLVQGVSRRLVFLMPRQSFNLYYSLDLPRRGCHRIGPLVFESGDVFGLFKKCWVDSQTNFITVLPNYRVIEDFQVGQNRRLADMSAERSIFEDPTRLRGIREYRRGDALKRIHWKATAHAGELVSKVYDPVLEAGMTIVLDFHHNAWGDNIVHEEEQAAPETAIEIACTICRYLSDGGWKVGLLSNGRDPLGLPGMTVAQAHATDSLRHAEALARNCPRDERLAPLHIQADTGDTQFQTIRENLGRLELTDGLPIEDALVAALPYIDRQQVLVVLAGEMPDSLVSGLTRVRALGYRMMVFVVRNPLAHERAFDALAPHGIQVFDMHEEWRLEEIATGRQSY